MDPAQDRARPVEPSAAGGREASDRLARYGWNRRGHLPDDRLALLAARGWLCTVWLLIAFAVGLIAYQRHVKSQRFIAGPVVTATILKVLPRKRGYDGEIAFHRFTGSKWMPCRTRVWLGDRSMTFRAGQAIKVAPRADSCGEPAVGTALGLP